MATIMIIRGWRYSSVIGLLLVSLGCRSGNVTRRLRVCSCDGDERAGLCRATGKIMRKPLPRPVSPRRLLAGLGGGGNAAAGAWMSPQRYRYRLMPRGRGFRTPPWQAFSDFGILRCGSGLAFTRVIARFRNRVGRSSLRRAKGTEEQGGLAAFPGERRLLSLGGAALHHASWGNARAR